MLIIIETGISLFGIQWRVIPLFSEWIKFIKSKPQSVRGMIGVAYSADRSMHPEPGKPALLKLEK